MKKLILILLITLSLVSTSFAQKDEFVGFYKGEIIGLKKTPWYLTKTIYGEVHRVGDNYRLRIVGNIFNRADNFFIKDELKATNGEILFEGDGKIAITEGSISPERIEAKGKVAKTDISFTLNRYTPPQKTLGQKAPEGAFIIFDGTDTSKLEHKGGIPCTLEIADGAIAINPEGKKGSVYTKEAFEGAFKLHVEFMCPADSYHLTGQQRNNSGIYIGDYEIQVLDSFGVDSIWEDCGAVYRQSAPYVNACLEAGAWQSYDIEFNPAKYEGDKLIKDPIISVYQNDIKVQHETPIYTATAGGTAKQDRYKHPKGALKIMLQEHKNKVKFRNIWLLPMKN